MASKCRYCGDDHNQRVTVDRELLIQLEDFLDDRADVMDGDYGDPRPNRAMQLLLDVRAVLEGSSGAPGNPASVSTLSSFSTTGAEEPSGTTPANTVPPVADLGKPANASLPEPAARPQEGGSASVDQADGCADEGCYEPLDHPSHDRYLLPDYVTPLRKLAAELGVKK